MRLIKQGKALCVFKGKDQEKKGILYLDFYRYLFTSYRPQYRHRCYLYTRDLT